MSWLAAVEFERMRQAWKGGAPVPAPARRVENLLSMRYLGEPDAPAPRLHDVRLPAPAEFMEAVLTGVDKLAVAGVVHSDLSAFNILVYEGRPFFIDFSGAIRVDRTGGVPWIRLTQARDALVHGYRALGNYFRRYGLVIDAESFVDRIIVSLDRFGTLAPSKAGR
jgi:RIO kinase 1